MATLQHALRLGPSDHGRAVSAEEFAAADYDGPWRYEREQGRLIVMPPDGPGHDGSSEPLRDHLVPIGWPTRTASITSSRRPGSALTMGRTVSSISASTSPGPDRPSNAPTGSRS